MSTIKHHEVHQNKTIRSGNKAFQQFVMLKQRQQRLQSELTSWWRRLISDMLAAQRAHSLATAVSVPGTSRSSSIPSDLCTPAALLSESNSYKTSQKTPFNITWSWWCNTECECAHVHSHLREWVCRRLHKKWHFCLNTPAALTGCPSDSCGWQRKLNPDHPGASPKP